jgi:transposase
VFFPTPERLKDLFVRMAQYSRATFKITPIACNPAAPHEKGKVEAAIKYIRQNFWPLRTFEDLFDVQRQARQWLLTVANPISKGLQGASKTGWIFNLIKNNLSK